MDDDALSARRARDLAYYYRHRDERVADMKARRDANLEAERQRERESYAKFRERRIAKSKRWNQANRHLRAARESDRRAMIAGVFVEPVHPLIVLELADGVCGICGRDVDPGNFQIDHIEPVSRGGEHSYLNTQPAHPKCNMAKGNRVTSPPPVDLVDRWASILSGLARAS
jgi:5-methylcytosine-specific restriction endonuclease McrA